MFTSSRLLVVYAALAFHVLAFSTAEGQQPTPQRVRIIVALVDRLPTPSSSDPAVVIRGRGADETEIILMREDAASPDALTSAVFLLLMTRQLEGWGQPSGRAIRVPADATPSGLYRAELPRAERVLTRLRSAAPRVVPGVGRVRAVDLYIPRRHVVARVQPRERS